ncbi:MAG TPA: DNA recombination protein RmuC [Aequorivita sp.]|jgi:DNA recombination protein RmuC|nr:DNA recombination protein RmuC [Aequorivita sp.]MBP41279.1 DNA recombination protein RmuC [Aequorivita sp.]HBC04314.1 DNA recombination protein RmuC [Aequorivita sp.]HNP66610.1 DNA recombination protein RmuC [Aequorivita sp.]|tara:strand:+ start:66304 stop:67644 length:1341 start_codon:yes stop_codon:yes gene_type:complete
MNETFLFLLLAAICLLIGAFLGHYFARLKSKTETSKLEERLENAQLQEGKLNERLGLLVSEKESLQKEKEQANMQLSRQSAEYEALYSELEKEKERFKNFEKDFNDKFENLANKILLDKTHKFTELNKENIEGILKPLNQKIKEFEEKVGKSNEDFIKGHAELGKQLQFLNEQNVKISEEANNLTKALKGESKTQGNWGELILERVLEKSNLVKDREYFVQKSYTDVDGNKVLPDVVIHLPNDKRMIIDSKVSLTAYEKYVNEENEGLKERFLKDHVQSLKNHITQLSSKKYEDLHGIQSPDFVLMFIPIEPALYLAQNFDNSFFYTAFQKNILLVSPTTLLSTLRTIDALWSNEKQQQNALEIANHASSLYHKFKILLDDLETVGNRIASTKSAYDGAMKKLTGNQNLIKDINKLEELGISPKDKMKASWLKKANVNNDDEQDSN